jgi:hypothetical protein
MEKNLIYKAIVSIPDLQVQQKLLEIFLQEKFAKIICLPSEQINLHKPLCEYSDKPEVIAEMVQEVDRQLLVHLQGKDISPQSSLQEIALVILPHLKPTKYM